MTPTAHFDHLETLDPQEREADLFSRLPGFLAQLKDRSASWTKLLSEVDTQAVIDRRSLASIPVLRKSDLTALQAENAPFGGLSGHAYSRVFMSPGPIFEPQGNQSDPWNFARALYAAGFRAGETIHNCFAYHMTPGGFMVDEAARAMGLRVFPAGVGNTEMQADAIAHIRPSGYAGTPDYLKVILDKAAELGKDISSITKALVSGGALFPSLRDEYRARGVAVLQAYGTADLGCIAYECEAPGGMIVNENIIVEIVRPGTGTPVRDGEVGEVVVTTFNETYPLVRFATGDLSAVEQGRSACGRTNIRLKGWMGRADQTTKIKGMFVHPSQVAEIAKRHPEAARLRLTVRRDGEQDAMTLTAETGAATDELRAALGDSLAAVTKMKGAVELVGPNELPNDGKVISDERVYG